MWDRARTDTDGTRSVHKQVKQILVSLICPLTPDNACIPGEDPLRLDHGRKRGNLESQIYQLSV